MTTINVSQYVSINSRRDGCKCVVSYTMRLPGGKTRERYMLDVAVEGEKYAAHTARKMRSRQINGIVFEAECIWEAYTEILEQEKVS